MIDLTHVDFCTGIGGFALAAMWAGFRTVAFAEIEPYGISTFQRHFPGVPNLGDLRTACFAQYRGAHLLTAGFPCQPFSVAGDQLGEDDPRYLWPAVRRGIDEIRPTWFVGENVPGIIGMVLHGVLADLEARGYQQQVFVVPAAGVNARHLRDRVWILAHAGRTGSEELDAAAQSEKQAQGVQWDGAERLAACWHPSWDADQSALLRMADGVPLGLDASERNGSIGGLGNGIVPQVAFRFLKAIAILSRQGGTRL